MPDAILFKPGALSDDEFALIAQHPVIGSEILRDVDFLGEGKLVVRHHHERWDGTRLPGPAQRATTSRSPRACSRSPTRWTRSPPTGRTAAARASSAPARRSATTRARQFDPDVVAAYDTISDETFAELRAGNA